MYRYQLASRLDRQFDLDGQSWTHVFCPNSAVVQHHSATCDGQTQANAAGRTVARIVDAEERLKDLRKRILRNAGTIVSNPDDRFGALAFDTDLHGRPLRGITDRVQHHILNGSPEQFPIAQLCDGAT